MVSRTCQKNAAQPSAPLHAVAAWLMLALALAWTAVARAGTNDFDITLDAREAPRGLLRASLNFTVAPGPFTLQYPKWIPGEHGPTGPVRDVVDLHMEAGGRELDWQRDPRDLYIFRTTIPPEAKTLRVEFNFLLPKIGRAHV